jgi:hypothetical protein
MAGLWSTWRNPANGEGIQSCTVLTCAPNAAMAEIHNRMPVILDEGDCGADRGKRYVDAAVGEVNPPGQPKRAAAGDLDLSIDALGHRSILC